MFAHRTPHNRQSPGLANPVTPKSGIHRATSGQSAKVFQRGTNAAGKPMLNGCAPGTVDVDVCCFPQSFGDGSTLFVYAAVDLATHWAFLELYSDMSAASSVDFLRRLAARSPFQISHIQTDSGMAFSRFATVDVHETTRSKMTFSKACAAMGITHRQESFKCAGNTRLSERVLHRVRTQLREKPLASKAETQAVLANLIAHHNQRIAKSNNGSNSAVE